MSRLLYAGLGLFVAVGACSLTTDLDGFHDPQVGPGDSGASSLDGGHLPLADAGAEGTTDAGPIDGGGSNVLFRDDFNRANGPVGNGWLDPTKSYRIEDNHLPVNGSGWAFQTNTLYQPKRDDALDIKASVEYTALALPPNYPQVHIRVRPGASYECYAVGIPQDNVIFFGRCAPQNNFISLGDQTLTENIVVGRTYRLSISAKGTSPVHLTMELERKTDDGFALIGHHEADDNAPERLGEPGAFGVSGDSSPNWVYDNFVVTKLTE